MSNQENVCCMNVSICMCFTESSAADRVRASRLLPVTCVCATTSNFHDPVQPFTAAQPGAPHTQSCPAWKHTQPVYTPTGATLTHPKRAKQVSAKEQICMLLCYYTYWLLFFMSGLQWDNCIKSTMRKITAATVHKSEYIDAPTNIYYKIISLWIYGCFFNFRYCLFYHAFIHLVLFKCHLWKELIFFLPLSQS